MVGGGDVEGVKRKGREEGDLFSSGGEKAWEGSFEDSHDRVAFISYLPLLPALEQLRLALT